MPSGNYQILLLDKRKENIFFYISGLIKLINNIDFIVITYHENLIVCHTLYPLLYVLKKYMNYYLGTVVNNIASLSLHT